MKKCENCGAIQNDLRNVCIDCGARLGKPMPESEANATNKALSEYVDAMSDRTDVFYIPLILRILGIVSFVAIIASIIMVNIFAGRQRSLKAEMADAGVSVSGGIYMGFGSGDMSAIDSFADRSIVISQGAGSSIIAAFLFIMPALIFLFPSAMWSLETWGWRNVYAVDMEPTDLWVSINRVIAFILFACGVIAFVYAAVRIL